MDGATQILNEVLAPVMTTLGISDAWIIVAIAAAILFLFFFILFISRLVKISRLKRIIREKDDQIAGLNAITRYQQVVDTDNGSMQSVVYTSAGVTSDLQDATRLFSQVGESGEFDHAWRAQNSEFLEKCETGTVFSGGNDASKHFTDAIFGGGSAKEAAAAQSATAGSGASKGDSSQLFPESSEPSAPYPPNIADRGQDLSGKIPRL